MLAVLRAASARASAVRAADVGTPAWLRATWAEEPGALKPSTTDTGASAWRRAVGAAATVPSMDGRLIRRIVAGRPRALAVVRERATGRMPELTGAVAASRASWRLRPTGVPAAWRRAARATVAVEPGSDVVAEAVGAPAKSV